MEIQTHRSSSLYKLTKHLHTICLVQENKHSFFRVVLIGPLIYINISKMIFLDGKLKQCGANCSKIPCCCCCKGRTPIILFCLLFVVSLIIFFYSFGQMQSSSSSKQKYMDSIIKKPSCKAYCGSKFQQEGVPSGLCCTKKNRQCTSRLICYQQTLEDYDEVITKYMMLSIFIGCCSGVSFLFLSIKCMGCLGRKLRGERPQRRINAINQSDPSLEETLLKGNPSVLNRLQDSVSYRGSQLLCSICLEGFSQNKSITLQCSHVFHSQCIKTWMKKLNSCPLCRSKN